MSHASELKIYNSALFLLKELYERVPKFNKQYKYLLGDKLIQCNVEIIKEISKANNQKSKIVRIKHIEMILEYIDEMFIYIRISEELHQFNSKNAYPYLIEKLSEISRQATGWKRLYSPQNF